MAGKLTEARIGWAHWMHGTIDHEIELTVHFIYTEWDERHPYGSTYATQRCNESEVTDYDLDGHETTYDALKFRFGKEFIDKKIDEALGY
jgi:hypothetical protein